MLDKRVSDASIRLRIMLHTCIDMFKNSDAGNITNVHGDRTRSGVDAGVSECIDRVSVSTLSNASWAYNGDLYEESLWVFGARGKAKTFCHRFSFPQSWTRTFHAVNALKTIRDNLDYTSATNSIITQKLSTGRGQKPANNFHTFLFEETLKGNRRKDRCIEDLSRISLAWNIV